MNWFNAMSHFHLFISKSNLWLCIVRQNFEHAGDKLSVNMIETCMFDTNISTQAF